jgi:S-adenosylmethionine:tRNA ribosyltransferase-isomerase
MLVSDFDYNLPEELIAQAPLPERAASRMLVVDRAAGSWTHRSFRDLAEFLRPGDCVALNDTAVLPARLLTRRPTGGRTELLLLRPLRERVWEALARPARSLGPGTELAFGGKLRATVLSRGAEGLVEVRLDYEGELLDVLREVGLTPLPPYIRRPGQQTGSPAEGADHERYQTVYAERPGAVAAPTAGLHFDEAMLERLAAAGVALPRLTLHVGLGTFRPVTAERVEEHHMHAEYYELGEAAARAINSCRAAGGRCLAVGTTVSRVLETVADEAGAVQPGSGWSELFMYPGYRFRAVDRLLTNFHLPRSTLLMLVSALAGPELIRAAYAEAVRERYRFFSYGDCMLIL